METLWRYMKMSDLLSRIQGFYARNGKGIKFLSMSWEPLYYPFRSESSSSDKDMEGNSHHSGCMCSWTVFCTFFCCKVHFSYCLWLQFGEVSRGRYALYHPNQSVWNSPPNQPAEKDLFPREKIAGLVVTDAHHSGAEAREEWEFSH